MDIWYNIVTQLLPFEWARHTFMQNALLGIILIAPIFGLLGAMVVNNKMAFFSDAIGHSALTGIAIGVIIGLNDPIISMTIFSVALGLGIILVKNKSLTSTDTIIAVFSSTAVALGIVILSRSGGFNKYSTYLIGDLLSITQADLIRLFVVLLCIVVLWVVMFNKLLLTSLNGTFARSRGIKVQIIEIIFFLIVAVVVTLSIQWVGLLIISSLLILPAAGARNISKNMRQYHINSLLIAFISGISGLILSYYWDTATGSTIVLISAVFFFLTFLIRLKIN